MSSSFAKRTGATFLPGWTESLKALKLGQRLWSEGHAAVGHRHELSRAKWAAGLEPEKDVKRKT